VDEIDELFNEWFWYFIWCGYRRDAAIRAAARRVLLYWPDANSRASRGEH
jgi:hypothetical protein